MCIYRPLQRLFMGSGSLNAGGGVNVVYWLQLQLAVESPPISRGTEKVRDGGAP